jgi:hypothetical protein
MSVIIVETVLLRITPPSEAEMVLSVTSEPSRVETSSGRKANRRQRKAESLMFCLERGQVERIWPRESATLLTWRGEKERQQDAVG